MASDRESPSAELAIAFAAVGSVIHHIDADQWASPTPCTQWPVRRVVGHLVGMNLVFAAMLADEPPPARFEIYDSDLAARYDASAAVLVARFSAPGTLERNMGGPLGSASGADRLWIRMYDLLAHGWDVARATGQRLIVPDELAENALAFATRQLDGVDRDGRFEPPQPHSAAADALDRLAAFLGRDPSWTPPPHVAT